MDVRGPPDRRGKRIEDSMELRNQSSPLPRQDLRELLAVLANREIRCHGGDLKNWR
jgi:hypothetical protein